MGAKSTTTLPLVFFASASRRAW